jgi:hypothetical protein
VTPAPPADVAAQAHFRRRELRNQISALEKALSEMQASSPGLIPSPSKPPRLAGPRLLSIEELERVRTGLVRRLAASELLVNPPAEAANARRVGGTERAEGKGADAKQPKPSQARKATRPRARTRPSTA